MLVHTGIEEGSSVKTEPGEGEVKEKNVWWRRVLRRRESWWAPGWDVERLGFDSSVGMEGGTTVEGAGVRTVETKGNSAVKQEGEGATVVHTETWYMD